MKNTGTFISIYRNPAYYYVNKSYINSGATKSHFSQLIILLKRKKFKCKSYKNINIFKLKQNNNEIKKIRSIYLNRNKYLFKKSRNKLVDVNSMQTCNNLDVCRPRNI